MRKLLLATVATTGLSMGIAAVADAQSTAPTPAAPPRPAAAAAPAGPAPGTLTVRLNGRFRFYAAILNDRDLENNLAGSAAVGTTANGLTPQGGKNKAVDYTFATYARLYPGFDGVAANGLRYGASLEIRQDQYSGAGGGAIGSISQQSRGRNGLYFYRLWGYLGTDQLGTIRIGATDGPSSLYMTGNFENFDSGGFNGEHPAFLAPAAGITWPFADVGNMQTGTKAVYLSPQLFGFDFGVSFEPNTGNGGFLSNCNGPSPVGTNFVNAAGNFTAAQGANAPNGIGPGCDRLSSSPVNAESQRRRNTVDALLRYRGTLAGFGVAATGSFIGSANLKDNSGLPFSNTFQGAAGPRFKFEGLRVFDFGAAVTYGGLSVGGKYQTGRFNGSWGPAVEGLDDSEAWLVGASYTFGPAIVGAHYLDYKSSGDNANAALGRQRRETGLAVGSTYSLAPGVSIFASYLYAQNKQNGYDYLTGQGVTATNSAGSGNRNKITSSVIALGTSFQW